MTTRIVTDANGRKHITNEPLLHPPKRNAATPREWVGLTDGEIDILHRISMDVVDTKGWGFLNHERFAKNIEAKLREKNSL